MVVSLLIGLCECVVESLPGSVVSVTAEIRFHLIGFGHLDVHSFYLIILHSNFYFELVWHDEFVSLDGVKVVLLLVLLPHLLSVLLLLLHFHLLLRVLLLLIWVHLTHHLLLLLHLHHLLFVHHLLLLLPVHVLLFLDHLFLPSHVLGGFFH